MNKSNGNWSREFMMPFGNCMIYMLLRLLPSAPLEAADDDKVCANQWGDSNIPRISSPNEQKCLIRWKTTTKRCCGSRASSSASVASWHLLHPANLHGPARQISKWLERHTNAHFLLRNCYKGLVNNCNMFWCESNERKLGVRVAKIPVCWCLGSVLASSNVS